MWRTLTKRFPGTLTARRQPSRVVSIILGVVLTTGLQGISPESRSTHASENEEPESVNLHYPKDYVEYMSDKLRFRFTIEYQSGADTFDLDIDEALDRNVDTLDAFVNELQNKVNTRVLIDRSDKRFPVVHLIDKELSRRFETLSQKVDFKYSGVVGQIGEALQRQGVTGLEGAISGGNTELFNDYITKIDIDVKQQSIRDILTRSVDLSRYTGLIWIARTDQLEDRSWKTQVRFVPQKRR